jgi:hypothetical protein
LKLQHLSKVLLCVFKQYNDRIILVKKLARHAIRGKIIFFHGIHLILKE